MINKKTRQQIFEKYHGHCAYCGVEIDLKSMQVDHIRSKYISNFSHQIEMAEYNLDDVRNLNPSCRRCNNFKAEMGIERFRSELQKQVKRGRKYSVNFRMAEKFGQIKITESPILFYFEKRHEFAQND